MGQKWVKWQVKEMEGKAGTWLRFFARQLSILVLPQNSTNEGFQIKTLSLLKFQLFKSSI